ncbi:MAG: LysR family transcriptional regulator [Bdellovibrionota bacterium]
MINNLIMENAKNWDLLQVLAVVAESRNFRDAAVRLHLSQAAVSLKLKTLQTLHASPLFALEGKKKVLTHYGNALAEIARSSTSGLAAQIEELDRLYSAPAALTVRVGGRSELMEIAGPLLDFEGRLEFLGMPSYQVLPSLQSRAIDIGITPTRPDSSDFVAKKIFRSRSYLAIHEKLDPGGSDEKVLDSLSFLMNTPCVGYIHEQDMLSKWVRHLGGNPRALQMKSRTDDWHVVRALVEAGMGYAILPVYIHVHHPKVRKIRIPERGVERLDFFAVFSTHLKKVPAFRELLAMKRFPWDEN